MLAPDRGSSKYHCHELIIPEPFCDDASRNEVISPSQVLLYKKSATGTGIISTDLVNECEQDSEVVTSRVTLYTPTVGKI